jgi:hypothetical protein
MSDYITLVQYSGYLHNLIRQREVNKVTEEARVQRILKEQREKIEPIYETKGKLVNILI